MFILGWGPSTYDGDYGLYPNFHSSQKVEKEIVHNLPANIWISLLEQGRKEVDTEKKKRNLY